MADSNSPENESENAPVRPAKRGTYFPNFAFWMVVALCAIALTMAARLSEDPALFNLLMVVSAVVCAFSLFIWFRFFSAYSLGTRRTVSRFVVGSGILAAVGATVLALATDSKIRFSGGMIPQIVKRTSLSDSLGEGQADLATTTPQDFPQFLGPDRNSAIEGVRLSRDWETNAPKLLWKHEIGAGWSAFAAVNGYAVTMEQRGADEELEVTTCYDVESGEAVWSSQVDARHTSVLGFLGPRSTPTIHEGNVYTVGGTGLVRCLDGATGAELWNRDPLKDIGVTQEAAEKPVAWGRSGSPLIVNDMLVVSVGGVDGKVVEGKIVTLMALDLATGETRWESGNYQIAYASPTLATLHGVQQILSVNENYITGHDVNTGKVLWEHPWEGLSNMNANCSQPHAIDDSRVFISKGYGRGAELFEVTPDGDDWNTTTVWSNKVMKTKFSNVAMRDGFVYGLDDGILSCVELETGERQWKKGRFGYGQVLMVDDLLLVMSELKGTVSLVEANPSEYALLGKFDAIEGQTWNNLCLYGNRLLVRNAEEAACFELPLE